jgi:hypothetical protein
LHVLCKGFAWGLRRSVDGPSMARRQTGRLPGGHPSGFVLRPPAAPQGPRVQKPGILPGRCRYLYVLVAAERNKAFLFLWEGWKSRQVHVGTSIPPTESSKGGGKELWLWFWLWLWLWLWLCPSLCAPWRARRSSRGPSGAAGGLRISPKGGRQEGGQSGVGAGMHRRQTPQAARVPGGQEARKARKRGSCLRERNGFRLGPCLIASSRLSFGYFSLDEQRKVTRLPDGRRNPSQGRHNQPRRRRTFPT